VHALTRKSFMAREDPSDTGWPPGHTAAQGGRSHAEAALKSPAPAEAGLKLHAGRHAFAVLRIALRSLAFAMLGGAKHRDAFAMPSIALPCLAAHCSAFEKRRRCPLWQ